MALKASALQKLEAINYTVSVMKSLDVTDEVIIEKTKEKVTELEAEENISLRLKDVDGQIQFAAFDLRSDFVRTRYNDPKTMLSLSAKITGLPIDVKVMKGSDEFTNADIVSALRDLADNVAAMPVEILKHGADEWAVTPGGMPELLKAEEDSGLIVGDDSATLNTELPDESTTFNADVKTTNNLTQAAVTSDQATATTEQVAVTTEQVAAEQSAPLQDLS